MAVYPRWFSNKLVAGSGAGKPPFLNFTVPEL
jgi:hypothetical protein